MIDNIKKALDDYTGDWSEKKSVVEFKTTIAERKAFLSKKRLTYSVRFRVDDKAKTVTFSEMLVEAGSGLSSGGIDDGISAGVGFKTETYNTMNKAREGTIEESSKLFGRKFEYKFNYKEIRSKVEDVVKKLGYKFEYQVLPVK